MDDTALGRVAQSTRMLKKSILGGVRIAVERSTLFAYFLVSLFLLCVCTQGIAQADDLPVPTGTRRVGLILRDVDREFQDSVALELRLLIPETKISTSVENFPDFVPPAQSEKSDAVIGIEKLDDETIVVRRYFHDNHSAPLERRCADSNPAAVALVIHELLAAEIENQDTASDEFDNREIQNARPKEPAAQETTKSNEDRPDQSRPPALKIEKSNDSKDSDQSRKKPALRPAIGGVVYAGRALAGSSIAYAAAGGGVDAWLLFGANIGPFISVDADGAPISKSGPYSMKGFRLFPSVGLRYLYEFGPLLISPKLGAAMAYQRLVLRRDAEYQIFHHFNFRGTFGFELGGRLTNSLCIYGYLEIGVFAIREKYQFPESGSEVFTSPYLDGRIGFRMMWMKKSEKQP